jgi:hypothetical protein
MALGFFQREEGIVLPHLPISLSVFLVVENAFRAAWQILRTSARQGFDLATAVEDDVTHELYEVLCDEIFDKNGVDGFDRQLFSKPTRESKVRNFNGGTLDKMPDLLIGLVNRPNVFKPSQDWIFVECKPVDAKHALRRHYCDRGLIRFVQGDYAWTMHSALMVGYVKTGITILPKLADAIRAKAATIPTSQLPRKCRRSASTSFSEPSHVSRHERTFSYVETTRNAPPITIRHLWLVRD